MVSEITPQKMREMANRLHEDFTRCPDPGCPTCATRAGKNEASTTLRLAADRQETLEALLHRIKIGFETHDPREPLSSLMGYLVERTKCEAGTVAVPIIDQITAALEPRHG